MKISRWIAGVAIALAGLEAGQAADDKPYQVADGNKVDKATLEGWRTWRALACERCHGAKQEGLVGPSLLDSLRRLSKATSRGIASSASLAGSVPSTLCLSRASGTRAPRS